MISFVLGESVLHPSRHPVNTFIERSSGFVPGDSWEPRGDMTELDFT